ncbi:AGAP009352-PA [Anopheles gambiae str. PEST]|uniref:AGAP009352-PA n=2 Tax=gambiae species complex TaxID=44542 RepID=Q5TVH1_ANOGA|nr:AGAP009352-PA [Anopheles gambiae str. PEST]
MKLYVQMMLLALLALLAFVGAGEMYVTDKVDPPPFDPDDESFYDGCLEGTNPHVWC